jgi:hypothetical protein
VVPSVALDACPVHTCAIAYCALCAAIHCPVCLPHATWEWEAYFERMRWSAQSGASTAQWVLVQ